MVAGRELECPWKGPCQSLSRQAIVCLYHPGQMSNTYGTLHCEPFLSSALPKGYGYKCSTNTTAGTSPVRGLCLVHHVVFCFQSAMANSALTGPCCHLGGMTYSCRASGRLTLKSDVGGRRRPQCGPHTLANKVSKYLGRWPAFCFYFWFCFCKVGSTITKWKRVKSEAECGNSFFFFNFCSFWQSLFKSRMIKCENLVIFTGHPEPHCRRIQAENPKVNG